MERDDWLPNVTYEVTQKEYINEHAGRQHEILMAMTHSYTRVKNVLCLLIPILYFWILFIMQ